MILTGDNLQARTETCPSDTLHTTHLSWTFLGSNSALSGERPAMWRSMNAGSLLESYRCFGRTCRSMFRKEEGIFSRWLDHVPQYRWPVSATSHNVTSRRKELHKKSEPRFELRLSRTWLKELKSLRRGLRWAPEMMNTKTEKPRRGGNRREFVTYLFERVKPLVSGTDTPNVRGSCFLLQAGCRWLNDSVGYQNRHSST